MSSGYGTHIAVLKVVQAHVGDANAVEFGCGMYSTKWLLENFRHLTTVELDEGWVTKVANGTCAEMKKRWSMVVVKDEQWAFQAAGRIPQADVVLVDGGDHKARVKVAQSCMDQGTTKAVVMHDAERIEYDWNTLWLLDGWKYVRCEGEMPWSAVATPNDDLVMALSNAFPCTICTGPECLRRISFPAIKAWDAAGG